MKRKGLITLADVPKLKGKDRTPTKTIAIARLDNNLRDKRYGAFKITERDVAEWQRNLAGVMGGEVSLDFDHSSERGRGTRAAGWISNVRQDGELVLADVRFTPRGAKAVRDGDFKFVSPTFQDRYTDEHGKDHGKALIGAALTNRPVLRKGMPVLSLAREPVELSQPPAKPVSPSRVPSNPTSSRASKSGRTAGVPPELRGKKPVMTVGKARRKTKKAIRRHLRALGMPAGEARTLTADMAPSLVDLASPARRVPLQPRRPAVYAATQGGSVYALSQNDRAGLGEFAEPGMELRVDPERAQLDQSARKLSKSLGVDYVAAAELVLHEAEGIKLAQADGSADVAWNDTRPLPPGQVDPFNPQHLQRDQRRAEVAGVDFNEDVRRAHALLGRDGIGEQAEQMRQQAVADHRQQGETMFAEAKHRGQVEAARAKNAELVERAQTQSAQIRRAREESLNGIGEPPVDAVPW